MIYLPPGTRSVPHQARLIAMTNSSSGYGYALGADAAGKTNKCSTNFQSVQEFLSHITRHLPCLSGIPSRYLFFKRTKGHGMRQITFSNYQELKDAIGRGALVILPDDNVPVAPSNNQIQLQPHPFPSHDQSTIPQSWTIHLQAPTLQRGPQSTIPTVPPIASHHQHYHLLYCIRPL